MVPQQVQLTKAGIHAPNPVDSRTRSGRVTDHMAAGLWRVKNGPGVDEYMNRNSESQKFRSGLLMKWCVDPWTKVEGKVWNQKIVVEDHTGRNKQKQK